MAGKNEPVVPKHEAIQNLKDDDDDVYFGSYSHFSIHEDMLQVLGSFIGRIWSADNCRQYQSCRVLGSTPSNRY